MVCLSAEGASVTVDTGTEGAARNFRFPVMSDGTLRGTGGRLRHGERRCPETAAGMSGNRMVHTGDGRSVPSSGTEDTTVFRTGSQMPLPARPSTAARY